MPEIERSCQMCAAGKLSSSVRLHSPLGVNGAAPAAFGDIRFFGGVDGVNAGESTLNLPRPKLISGKSNSQPMW